MRVTDRLRYMTMMQSLDRKAQDLQLRNEIAVTGRKINRPSQGAAGYATALTNTARMEQLEGRAEAIQRSRGDLSLAESSLAGAGDILKRARELATQMADGTYSAADRAVAAQEVASLRDQLRGYANAQGSRGYLFAGTATDTEPFDPAGNFVANDQTMGVTVADGITAPANVSGAVAFAGANGGRDVLADLANLEAMLLADNQAGVQASIDDLDAGHQQIQDVRAEAGITLDRLGAAGGVLDGALVTAREAIADVAEADPVRAFSDLARAQGAYQESLQVASNLLKMATAIQRF
ncbi:MAG: hypothetical protein KC731_35630 [Myxococcales bacterium]|nr:hypothetical protein [Myxococcales bacterium]